MKIWDTEDAKKVLFSGSVAKALVAGTLEEELFAAFLMQIFVVTPCITWTKVLEYHVYRKVSSLFMYYQKK